MLYCIFIHFSADVYIDVALTFNETFNPLLNDSTSEVYQNFSSQATSALKGIIDSTPLSIANYSSVTWEFSEGSVISTARNILVSNAGSSEEAMSEITNFQNDAIPNLIGISTKGDEHYSHCKRLLLRKS